MKFRFDTKNLSCRSKDFVTIKILQDSLQRRPGELVRDGGGDEANTIEQTGAGTFRETWVQEETGFKIVLTLDHFGDRVTMVQPGFTHKVFDVTQALLRRAVTL